MSNNITPASPKSETVDKYQSNPIARAVPPVDVYENDKEVLVLADLPGVTQENLHVELDHPELSITADAPHHGGGTLRYQRQFRVGSAIDPGRIEAELKNGTLSIRLPKSDAYRARKIEIRAS
jgi:HSP20 family protein